MRCSQIALSLIGVLALTPDSVIAQSQSTWTNDSGDKQWSNSANWTGSAPTTGSTHEFLFQSNFVTNPDLPPGTFTSENNLVGVTATGITFNNTAASPSGRFLLSGNQITLSGNISTVGNTASPTNRMSMGIVLNGSHTITTALGNNLEIAGAISESGGSRSLVKEGAGNLILSGANSFTGGIVVNGGSLQVGNGGVIGSLGSGNVTVNTAMSFNRTDTAGAFSNSIAGSGTVTQAGTGTVTLSGNNTYTGQTK